ncbi:MAG: ABC transporter permease, partial [Lentisphaeria bacterium]|nr:ABC transporter permease [Lentisphaeria bacterium]
FSDKMREKLLDTTSHAQIRPVSSSMAIGNVEEICSIVNKAGGSALPITISAVLMQTKTDFVPKVMIGLDPKRKISAFKLSEVIEQGKYSLKHGEIIISYVVARQMGLSLGDKVLLHSSANLSRLVKKDKNGRIALAENAQLCLPTEFTVSGISNFGKYDFDRDFLFLNIDDANELLNLDWGLATGVYVWTKDPFRMNSFMEQVSRGLEEKAPLCRIDSWQTLNKRLLDVLQVEKSMQFFLLIFIVLVAAFSITNTLITTVIQKTKEIGLLKAVGASSGTVCRIFILQGFFVGFLGTTAGIVLGALVVKYRMVILRTLRVVTGQEIFPKEFYVFNELPAHIIGSDLALIGVISILLCTLGAVIPAIRAAGLDPAKALRYE